MKKNSRIIKSIISTVLCLALVMPQGLQISAVALAQEAAEAVTANVTTEAQLVAALNNADVDVICLQNEITISRSSDGKDNAFVIPRSVTITGQGTGGGLRLERAGIVLGGAVTMEHMSIYFANPVRNAIVANGYSLTLNNISNGESSYNIDVFAGAVTDYIGGNPAEIPQAGTEANIVIKGTNALTGKNTTVAGGNIYAGSLSDVSSGAEDAPNEYTGSVAITIEKDASGMGQIYAHGARENREGGAPNAWIASAELYKVSGEVNISLHKCANVVVDGATGGIQNATFTYKDDGRGYLCSPTLINVAGIALLPSEDKTKAYLAPVMTGTCSFSALSVPSNTRLSFAAMSADEISASTFTGGGEIIFSEEVSQVLSVTAQITGITKVAVGGITADGVSSTATIAEGKKYIAVDAKSAEDYSFELLPDYNNSNMVLNHDGNGNWVTTLGESTIVIDSIGEVADVEVTESAGGESISEILVPMSVTYAAESDDNFLGDIPMLVTVNGKEASREFGYMGYQYATGVTSDDILMGFSYEGDNEVFYIANYESYEYSIPAGKYEIAITIPGRYMQDGLEKTLSFIVTTTKETMEKEHVHDWSYTAENGVISAACIAENCDLAVEDVKFAIVVPNDSDLIYDGTAKNAVVDVSVEGVFEIPAISYATKSGKVLEKAPADAGTYVASITMGEGDAAKTAAAEFTIRRKNAEIIIGNTVYNKVFGDAAFALNVIDTNAEADVQYKVMSSKDLNGYTVGNNAVVTMQRGVVSICGTGTAVIEITLAQSTNYNAAASKRVTVNIKRADNKVRLPAVGTVKRSDDGKATYKVTKSHSKKGTVSYVAPKNKKKTTVTIPATVTIDGVKYKVTAIEKNAFKNNKKIKSVTIGKNVTKIGSKAFYGCTKLKTLTIKTTKLSKSKIGSKAFTKTPKSMKVKVPKKKLSAYKKILKAKGVHKKAKFKKL